MNKLRMRVIAGTLVAGALMAQTASANTFCTNRLVEGISSNVDNSSFTVKFEGGDSAKIDITAANAASAGFIYGLALSAYVENTRLTFVADVQNGSCGNLTPNPFQTVRLIAVTAQ